MPAAGRYHLEVVYRNLRNVWLLHDRNLSEIVATITENDIAERIVKMLNGNDRPVP